MRQLYARSIVSPIEAPKRSRHCEVKQHPSTTSTSTKRQRLARADREKTTAEAATEFANPTGPGGFAIRTAPRHHDRSEERVHAPHPTFLLACAERVTRLKLDTRDVARDDPTRR
jgi:hypothetical protein